MNPRRLRLMDECWPILMKGFDDAVKTLDPTAAGAGQATYGATAPGRLVTTLSTISGGSDKRLGGQDTNLSTKGDRYRWDIDELVHLCREQRNGNPAVVGPLEKLVTYENARLLDGLYVSASPLTPGTPTLARFLKEVTDLVPARPLVALVKGRDDLSPDERDDHQVRSYVNLRGQDRALVYTNARHLVVHQVIEPVTLDWDLADDDEVALFITSRSVLRRHAGHQVFVWT